MKDSKPFIGIAGNIGVGKTTFTKVVAEHLCWKEFYESVSDNPYLDDFYQNMSRWSFNLQIYFLKHRFSDQVRIMNCNHGAIQDRTIYEDVEIFAKNLYEMKYISDRDWMTYIDLFKNMVQFLNEPDLFFEVTKKLEKSKKDLEYFENRWLELEEIKNF